MNIVLIGYRGTGKSSVGKTLAIRLGRTLVSTDAEIIRRAGKPIPEIVAQDGWEHFRDLESEVCRDFSGSDGLVIDTGGGAILRPENARGLKQNGQVFWLTASISTIVVRIAGDTQRPSLTGTSSFIDEIKDVLRERVPKYEAAADFVVPTDGRSVDSVIQEIIRCLNGTCAQ